MTSIQEKITNFTKAFNKLVRREIHLNTQNERNDALYAEKMSELNTLLDDVRMASLNQKDKSRLNDQISQLIRELQLAFSRTDHRGSYNPEIAEIVANASRVLREWDHVKPTKYDDLLDGDQAKLQVILRQTLPEEIAEVIIPRYRNLPPQDQNEYVTKVVAMEIINAFEYAKILLPQYYGLMDGRLDIPDVGSTTHEDEDELHVVLKSVLAHSLVPRTLWDSLSVMVQSAAAAPGTSILTVGATIVALPVAVSLAPVTTAVTSAVSSGVAAAATSSVAPAITDFISQNIESATATVYFTWTNREAIYEKILSMLSIPQSARAQGDVVALFDQINTDFLHRGRDELTGIPPADIANLFDAIKYISWYFKSACVSQAHIAGKFVRAAVSLPGNLAIVCKRVAGGVGRFVSNQASTLELKNMGDTVANETFVTFHDELRRLMNEPDIAARFTTPDAKTKLERHKRNLETMDHRIFTVFSQRVELHNARDAAQHPWLHREPDGGSQGGVYGGEWGSQGFLEEEPVEQTARVTGAHGEALASPAVIGTDQPPGTGDAVARTRENILEG